MGTYIFLCDPATEQECLQSRLAGTTQENAIWALELHPGDTLFIYNFRSGLIHGPLVASTATDCHEPQAWGGRFPIQVRFDLGENFRSFQASEFASSATLKLLRRGGPLTTIAKNELLS